MTSRLLSLVLVSFVLATGALAQEAGAWHPLSNTARSITGELVFSKDRISINFNSFPLLLDRALQPTEISAIVDTDDPSPAGHLFRLSVAAPKLFLHHNTLCGSEPVQWLTTVVTGRTLQLAFFSGAHAPTLTAEAVRNSTNLCGTYTYTR